MSNKHFFKLIEFLSDIFLIFEIKSDPMYTGYLCELVLLINFIGFVNIYNFISNLIF